jgi:hypothetical protein
VVIHDGPSSVFDEVFGVVGGEISVAVCADDLCGLFHGWSDIWFYIVPLVGDGFSGLIDGRETIRWFSKVSPPTYVLAINDWASFGPVFPLLIGGPSVAVSI